MKYATKCSIVSGGLCPEIPGKVGVLCSNSLKRFKKTERQLTPRFSLFALRAEKLVYFAQEFL